MQYIKSGFKPAEMKMIDDLISTGFGKSRSEIVRIATLSFISHEMKTVNISEGADSSA